MGFVKLHFFFFFFKVAFPPPPPHKTFPIVSFHGYEFHQYVEEQRSCWNSVGVDQIWWAEQNLFDQFTHARNCFYLFIYLRCWISFSHLSCHLLGLCVVCVFYFIFSVSEPPHPPFPKGSVRCNWQFDAMSGEMDRVVSFDISSFPAIHTQSEA